MAGVMMEGKGEGQWWSGWMEGSREGKGWVDDEHSAQNLGCQNLGSYVFLEVRSYESLLLNLSGSRNYGSFFQFVEMHLLIPLCHSTLFL